jgi:hypothetical protein
MRAIILAGLILISPLAAPAADKFQPLDVKPGLWEMTLSVTTSGQMPIPAEALAKLSPEQRAGIEERMKARASQGEKTRTSTRKHCITKEDLSKDPFSDQDKSCTRTLVSSTRSKAEMRVNCTRKGVKSSGTIQIQALDSEHVKGSGHMVSSGGGNTMNASSSFSSKWISSSCGSTR